MDLLKWAKKEINLVNKDADDYYKACCKSALKAFKALCKDGHSGYSIQVTKSILDRLIEGQPLSPITEEDFNVNDKDRILDDPKYLDEVGLIYSIQCPRMSSLFKNIYKDGTVEYNDVNRVVYIDNDSACQSGLADKIVNELYPITLPYYPASTPYKVYGKSYYERPEDGTKVLGIGGFNVEEFDYLITPDGKKVELNKVYKEDSDGKMRLVHND